MENLNELLREYAQSIRRDDGTAFMHADAIRELFRDAWTTTVAPPSQAALSRAEQDVIAERRRQAEVEGWTPEHDDKYVDGEMARAASQYALHAALPFREGLVPAFWPWDVKWWKPTTPRRDLIKAAALCIAEIERIERAGEES